MLDETRSKQILNELVISKISITSDVVTELVRHIDSLVVLRAMANLVDTKTARLFIKKYVQLANNHEGPLPKFPGVKRF